MSVDEKKENVVVEKRNESDSNVAKAKKGRQRKKRLYKNILTMMEFYFSDANLAKDRFLSNLLKTEPFVDLDVFLRFNRIKSLTTNVKDIENALKTSELLEVKDGKVQRKKPFNESERNNVDECTIYVERIPTELTHDQVANVFKQFGKVVYVSLPRFKHNKQIKGFAFVEFETKESVAKVLDYFQQINCKMAVDVAPEMLYSIKTFEADETKKNVSSAQNVSKECKGSKKSENASKIEENESIENEKMEISSQTENVEENVPKVEAVDVQVESKKRSLSDDDGTDADCSSKKTKLNDETAKQVDDEQLVEMSDEQASDVEKPAKNDQEPGEKKKKLRRKYKKYSEINPYNFQVLSKHEWKRLRNTYLNLQKQKMRQLKQQLWRSKTAHSSANSKNSHGSQSSTPENDERKNDVKSDENKANVDSTMKVPKYTPGTIIKLQLSEPCVEIKEFKQKLKNLSPEVKYVDIHEGVTCVYIRLSAVQFAEEIINNRTYPKTVIDAHLLNGDDEKSYFEKIDRNREEKFKKDKARPKQRGRTKVLKRVEKELAKHIRFDE